MTPATAPLEDVDLLSEILLRLSPQPSSLPHASAVCKRWRSLVSAPRFIRRFRLRHRRNPSILGLFCGADDGIHFQPTMDPPNRVRSGRFFLQFHGCTLAGCRHGLVLALDASWGQVLVWDPVTGEKYRAAIPPGFGMVTILIDGTVLRAAGDHFQVVLVGYKEEQDPLAVVCFYSSETGVWSNLETPVAEDAMDYVGMSSVLVGDSLFWVLSGTGDSSVVLQFDLDRQSLAVIQLPVYMFAKDKYLMVMRAEGGGLGLLSLSGYTAQLWKRNTDCNGVSSWVLGRTIELDMLLHLDSQQRNKYIQMIAYAEENNVVLLRTVASVFMVQLESLKFNKLPENDHSVGCYLLESVYATEKSIGAGHDAADQHMLV